MRGECTGTGPTQPTIAAPQYEVGSDSRPPPIARWGSSLVYENRGPYGAAVFVWTESLLEIFELWSNCLHEFILLASFKSCTCRDKTSDDDVLHESRELVF